MSTIRIGNLVQRLPEKRIFRDVRLDLTQNNIESDNNLYKPETSTDIKGLYDENAIKNALKSLFTTKPGQKPLQPEFGLDLAQYLFDPLDDITANSIRQEIFAGVERWEPRVRVRNVTVQIDYDNYMFIIDLIFSIPLISENEITLTGTLTESSSFTETI